jgi:hypothetical protein
MSPEDLRALLERLAHGPTVAIHGGRHLYLWHGEPGSVEEMVPPALRRRLDLYDLAGRLPRTPYADDEAQRLLGAGIERELQALMAHPSQQVLLVGGCSLLARYRVPLQPFYAFVSDRRAVILVVARQETEFIPTAALPEFVHLDPAATFVALSGAVGEQNVIVEGQERQGGDPHGTSPAAHTHPAAA